MARPARSSVAVLLAASGMLLGGLVAVAPAASARSVVVTTAAEAQAALDQCGPDGVSVVLGGDIDDTAAWSATCTVSVDLAGRTLRTPSVTGQGSGVTIQDSSHDQSGVLHAAVRTNAVGAAVRILGGEVHAVGTGTLPAIGSSHAGDRGISVVVAGGEVTATATDARTAAVGSGVVGSTPGPGLDVRVTGGSLTAVGHPGGRSPAIGGASGATGSTASAGGEVVVTGGVLVASGGVSALGGGVTVSAPSHPQAFGHLTVSGGVVRLPDGPLLLPDSDSAAPEILVGEHGRLEAGADGSAATVTGSGQIQNDGAITLPAANVLGGGVSVLGHHHAVSFDPAHDDLPATAPVTVLAGTLADAGVDLPTPIRSGHTLQGWTVGPDGDALTVDSALPGSSADGTPIPVTAYAAWRRDAQDFTRPVRVRLTGTAAATTELVAEVDAPEPAAEGYGYAWRVEGAWRGGDATFRPTLADVGRSVTVTVTATRTGYTDSVATSAPLTVVPGRGYLGSPVVGATLTTEGPAGAPVAWSLADDEESCAAGEPDGADPTYVVPERAGGRWLRHTWRDRDGSVRVGTCEQVPTLDFVAGLEVHVDGEIRAGTALRAVVDRATDPAADGVTFSWRVDGVERGTGATYAPTLRDQGLPLALVATATREGRTPSVVSTDPVVVLDGRGFAGSLKVGRALTPDSDDAAEYVWEQAEDPACVQRVEVVTRDATSYLVPEAAAGRYLRLTLVDAPAAGGRAWSGSCVGPVAPAYMPFATSPTVGIQGPALVGRTLTAVVEGGDPVDGVSRSFAWWADGEPIPGATGTTLVLAPAQRGAVVSVRVTSTHRDVDRDVDRRDVTDSPTTAPVRQEFVVDPLVEIDGTPQVGVPLVARVTRGDPSDAEVAVTWIVGDEPITGPSATTFVPRPADLGETVRVRVRATAPHWVDAEVTSDPTPPVLAGTLVLDDPVVSGSARVGEVLTCTPPPAPPAVSLSAAWFVGDAAIPAGTDWIQEIGPGAVGARLSCEVTATLAGYDDLAVTGSSEIVRPGLFSVGDPVIDAPARVGLPLGCATAAGTPGEAAFSWWRGRVLLAEAATYTPAAGDVGAVLTCRIVVTRPGYDDATASTDTALVAPAPAGSYRVRIRGKVRVGRTLVAAVDAPARARVTWAWYRSGSDVEVGRGERYVVDLSDRGARLRAVATVRVAGRADAVAAGVTRRPVRLPHLDLVLSRSQVGVGGVVRATIGGLVPGERWSLGIVGGQCHCVRVIARGVAARPPRGVPAGLATVVALGEVPRGVRPGDRLVRAWTHDPERRTGRRLEISAAR